MEDAAASCRSKKGVSLAKRCAAFYAVVLEKAGASLPEEAAGKLVRRALLEFGGAGLLKAVKVKVSGGGKVGLKGAKKDLLVAHGALFLVRDYKGVGCRFSLVGG